MSFLFIRFLLLLLALTPVRTIAKSIGKDLATVKRFDHDVTQEQAYRELKLVVSTLKKFIHEDYVEISRFCINEADLRRRLTNIREFVEMRAFSRTKRNELDYAITFLGCMHEVAAAFSLKCEYWGSDIVGSMGQLSVQILRLYRIEGDVIQQSSHREIARFEDRFNDLQYRVSTDTKILDTTRQTIEMYAKDVKNALEITKANIRFDIQRVGGIFCKGGYLREAWLM